MNRIKGWLPELGLMAVAAMLSAPGLGSAPFSFGEARIHLFATDSWSHLARLFSIGADMHIGTFFPYVFLMKLWSGAGDTEFVMRLPSLAAGLASTVVVYFFVRRLFGRWAALIAALMFTIAPYHIMASRTLGANSIGVFLFVLGLYFFHRIYEGERGAWVVAGFAVVMLGGVNFGFYSALLLVPMNVLFIGFGKERVKSLWWWVPLNLILFACAVYWSRRWSASFFVPQSAWAAVETPPIYGFVPDESFVFLKLRLMFLEKYVGFLYTLGGLYMGKAFANGWSVMGCILIPIAYHYFPFLGFREYEDGYRARVFVFIVLVLIIGMAAWASLTAAPLWELLLPASVLFYAAAGNGAARFAGWRSRAMLAVMLLSVIFGFIPMQRADERGRPDWRAAASLFEASPSDTRPIVFIDGSVSLPFLYYGRRFQSRVVSLSPDFDMKIMGPDRYRQEEVMREMKLTIDPHAPDGIALLFANSPELWVIRKGEKLPEAPQWAREYAIWIQKYAALIQDAPIGGDFRIQLYRLKSGS